MLTLEKGSAGWRSTDHVTGLYVCVISTKAWRGQIQLMARCNDNVSCTLASWKDYQRTQGEVWLLWHATQSWLLLWIYKVKEERDIDSVIFKLAYTFEWITYTLHVPVKNFIMMWYLIQPGIGRLDLTPKCTKTVSHAYILWVHHSWSIYATVGVWYKDTLF